MKCVLACAILAMTGAFAHAQPPLTLEAIVKAWRSRQDRVRSVKYAWVERHTVPRGYYTHSYRAVGGAEALREAKIADGEMVPNKDTVFEVDCAMTLDGRKARFERTEFQWSPEKRDFIYQQYEAVFDGKLGKTLLGENGGSRYWPQATVRPRRPNGGSPIVSQFLACFRPLDPDFRPFNIESFVLTGRRPAVAGKPCPELELRAHGSVYRIWVDPAREFVVVRSTLARGDRPAQRVDVRYRQEDACGWIPDTVHYAAYYPDGSLEKAIQAKVKEHQVNSAVDPASFDLPFPAGTVVRDDSNPKAEAKYIVREGGGKRMVQRHEWFAKYEQLVSTDGGSALTGRLPSWWPWSLGLLALAAVAAGGILRWRTRRGGQAV